MKPLRIKKRTSGAGEADVPAAAAVATMPNETPATCVSSAVLPLTPTPPPSRRLGREHAPSDQPAGRPTSGSSSASARTATESRGGVKFASDLDDANVEAYLEYLTRPHTSWDSATRHLAHRREVIEHHRASVFARSLTSSLNASFVSTMRSTDALEQSTTSSVASAPAGFPRTATNSSKTLTGTLRKGRLGDGNAAPAAPSLLAMGTGASPAQLLPASSCGVSNASRAASSHSSVSAGQRAPSTSKGRLSRGGALAGPRVPRTSTSAGGATASSSSPGPDLTVGGTHLQAGSTRLLVGGAAVAGVTTNTTTTAGGRSASRDGAGTRRDAKGKAKGGRDVGSA